MKQKRKLTMPANNFRVAMKRLLIFTAFMLVPAVSSFAGESFTATTLGDFGNVTVMEVSGNYDELTPEGEINSLPRERISQEFYATHKDDYDFLVIFSNFDFKLESDAVAFYLGVKNDTLGIGTQIFDNGYLYGSGGKLQGTIDMGNIESLVSSPVDPRFDFTLDTLAHEMLHRWVAHVKFRDSSGELSTALLGKDGSHWSYLLDTNGSLEYGNKWKDNGNGTFTSIAARKYYSPLDLYLMGMIERSDVPPMLLIQNSSIDPKKVSSGGDTISGTPSYVTIDDIISAEGERVPSAKDAQKQFKMAFILVTPGTVTRNELFGIENIRKEFLSRFSILTDGQGLVQVVTTAKENLPVNPGLPPVEPGSRTLPPSMDDGVNWLLAAQNEDGTWGEPPTAERDTAKVVTVLENLSIPSQAQALGLQWLTGSGSRNTDYLSAKIVALAAAGQDVSAFRDTLLPLQNSDGGWGSDGNFLSNPLDTCSALKALLAANSTSSAVDKGVAYLLARQSSDGGWGFLADAASNILVSAEVSATLQRLPATTVLAMVVDKATSFLLSHQNADGGFGSFPSTCYESALAFIALSGTTNDETVLREGITYLSRSQNEDGSWNQDPYSTALAVEALKLAGTKLAQVPTTATVTGTVIDAATNQPLSGAVITLQGTSSAPTETAIDGSFSLSEVPLASPMIAVSLNGYAPYTQSVDTTAGSLVDLGTISLTPNSTTGSIRGVITSAATGEPLAGVRLALTGSYGWNGQTNEDGSFLVANMTPGSITITAALEGYQSATATGMITAGSVLTFNPQLTVLTPPPTVGSVAGTVQSAATGQPLAGVAVTLQSDPTKTVQTDSSGNFALTGLSLGNQTVEFVFSGYAPSGIGVYVSAGSTLNLGIVALSATPSVSSIRGTVSDASTAQFLSGAAVTIGGAFSGTTVADQNGSFYVSGVSPGAVTVTASKEGYYPVKVTGTVTEGGELFLNPQLSAMPPQAMTGTMTGIIVDALTHEPLAGVTVTLKSDASISATSKAWGEFTLAGIPAGSQEVDFDLTGYATSTITLDMAAGTLVNIGSLPLASNPTTGTINGTITDAAHGQPLSGVTVTVSGSFSASVLTDLAGSFHISQVPPGDVTVTASKVGYQQITGTGTIVAGGVRIFSPQMPIMPPQPTTGSITGKLVDASTRLPLGGVAIVVDGNPAIHSETDATGSFLLADIPAGLRNISFARAGYSSASASVGVAAGFVIDLGTVPLSSNPTTGVLKGTITDAKNGQPIEGATIAFSGSSAGSADSGADGTFFASNVAPGEIVIIVTKAGFYSMTGTVTVAAGSVLFFNLQLTAIPPEPTSGSVIGRIVDGTTSQPLSGVSVTLVGDPSLTSRTDEAGGFMLAGLPPGGQTLDFALSGYATAAATVEVQAGLALNLGTLPFSANPTTGMIKGVITDAGDGLSLSGVTITVTGSFSGNAITGADGVFIFQQVSPGEVAIAMAKPGYDPVTGTGTVNVGGVLVANAPLRKTPPVPPTGDLSGNVLDRATLEPIQGALVYLLGVNPVTSDVLGTFTMNGLEPGSYEVSVSAQGYAGQIYQVLIVAGTGTEMPTIYLSPIFQSTTVTGTVTDLSTGTPLADADVVIPGTNMSAKTDSLGSYSIAGIHLAEFSLRASAQGYDAVVIPIKTSAYVMRSIDFGLSSNRTNDAVTIATFVTDKQNYTANDNVTVTADIENAGSIAAGIAVVAKITDQQGGIVALLSPAGATTVTVDPFSTKTVSLQWGTERVPPGTYGVTLAVKDRESGVLLDEREFTFVIEPAFALTNATLNVSPSFTYAGKTETVILASILSYTSNITAEAHLEYALRNSQGQILRQGLTTASLSPDQQTVFKEIDQFTEAFGAGEYTMEVSVVIDGETVQTLPATLAVLPDLRIEMQRNVTPPVIVPDGSGKVRITIELKGGEK